MRRIYQHFPQRSGQESLVALGYLEESPDGACVVHLDGYPSAPMPDGTGRLVVLAQGMGQVPRKRRICQHFPQRSGPESLVPMGTFEENADGSCVVHLDALPSTSARDGMGRLVVSAAQFAAQAPQPPQPPPVQSSMVEPTGASEQERAASIPVSPRP